MKNLQAWKSSSSRKPLLLKGARQVGKTWILQELGRQCYKNTAYINFDENPDYAQLFADTKNPRRILQNLSLLTQAPLLPEETLIIFDEIQGCPDVIGALKYFCEQAPEFHVAAAGSLLGVALPKPTVFPVGKVDYVHMYPMTFSEFLMAHNKRNLLQFMQSVDTLSPLPEAFAAQLTEELKFYFLTGGMPEAVKSWTEQGNIREAEHVLANLVFAYERDFSRHPDTATFPKISRIWQSLPRQLARENRKFHYRDVKENARAREYEDALQWLVDAGIVYKVSRATAPRLPLSAYEEEKAFKVYMQDIGILRRQAQLQPTAVLEGSRLFTEFRGALTENYVLQALLPQFDVMPRYWTQTKPPYEIDFLLQQENQILPVEVKAGSQVRGKSLKKFGELYDVPLKIRFSLRNLKFDGDVLNIPLYMADEADRLIALARTHEQKNQIKATEK